MTPSTPARPSLEQCSATRSMTGRYGTADSSHELLSCTFATVLRPACFARAQWRVARGPGPTADIEYSPTVDRTPPRSIGNPHSLTDMSHEPGGDFAISSGASPWPCQPQSQTIIFASGLP